MSNNPLRAILFVLALPLLTSAQSVEQSVQSEVALVSVLCRPSTDDRSRENLLKSHPQLVNSQLWTALIRRAVADYYSPFPEKSFAIYEIALMVADRLQSPKLLATTYYNIGRSYSGLNQLSKAIEAYENSRRIFHQAGLQRDLSYVLADLGRLNFILEDHEKARSYSEQSLALIVSTESEVLPTEPPEEYTRATALATLADLYLRDGDYDQAIQKLRASLALHQSLSRQNSYYSSFIADDLQALGRVFTASGDYTEALAYLNQALNIVKNLSDPTRMANLLNSVGVLYLEQEDYAQAKKSLDGSLQIYLSINKQREAAEVLLNLAVIEQRQSNNDQALSLFQRSLQVAKATKIVDVEIAAGEGIGVVLTEKKDFSGAVENLNRSLEIAKSTGDKTRQTELLWRSAETYYEMGNYAQAVAYAESAVALARSARLPKLAYLATTTLGQVYAAQGKLDAAKQVLTQAVEQLEMLRNQVAGPETAAQLFFENKLAPYHALVEILVKQGHPFQALLYAERAKGRVLLDVVSGGRPDLSKVVSSAEKEESLRLNRKISELNDRIKKQTADPVALNSLYSQLDAARLEYQAFQDALYVAHPGLRIRSGRTGVLTATDVGTLTASGTLFLNYVVTKDRVLLLVLTKDVSSAEAIVKVYPIGIKPSDLLSKVNQFHDRLANRHPDYASISRGLYSLLVSPAENEIGDKTLCVIPDSFLWNLPFQVLMKKDGQFIIEDHAIYYAPSLSVLREMSQKGPTTQRKGSSLIAFGNPVIRQDEQRNELCPLPEAETEVNSIAKSFGPKEKRVLIGRLAAEQTFRAVAPTYSNIHLATHGVIDNRQPLYSHLLLTKTEGDPENDGLLEAREIMNMNLGADLAVLSACETANGKIAPGEGVMGMSWAFFIAGTRSMLVSQWKVNSASTSRLMMTFYQQNQTNTKATALQHTAVRLMKDQHYRHPFYWAGFVMIGQN